MSVPPEKVAEWKQIYGRVCELVYDNTTYIFRPVTFIEYDDSAAQRDWSSADAEDYLVSLAVLWPPDFDIDKVKPGLVTNLADEIIEVSGHGTVYPIIHALDDARSRAGAFRGLARAFILAAMPAYKLEDLDNMNIYELIDLLALAEKILEVHGIATGAEVREPLRLVIKTPEEIEAERQAKLDEGNARAADPIAQKLYQAAMMEGVEL